MSKSEINRSGIIIENHLIIELGHGNIDEAIEINELDPSVIFSLP